MDSRRKIILILSFLICLLLGGTAGYMWIEDLSLLDALYMTVITVSTVGFREVKELSDTGKFFTVIIIFAGLGTVVYGVSSIATFIIEGEFRDFIRRYRMENKINAIKDHYIVCGGGKSGMHVAREFLSRKVPFVVIEKDEIRAQVCMENDILVLVDDATSEDALKKAGIKRAKGLISCLSSDADNVFTVLTARGLASDLYIIAEAIEEQSEMKLKKAGANKTVSPNRIGGSRMASLVLRPVVVSFLDVITHAEDFVLDLEEIHICPDSMLVGQNLQEARIPERTGLIVLAMTPAGREKMVFNPRSDQILEAGCRMIVLGQADQIKRLRQLACDPER